jgi:hypothetical protein
MARLIAVNPSKVGLLMESIAFSYRPALNKICLLAMYKRKGGRA